MIELSDVQRRELNTPEPIVVDPHTKQTYVLVSKEVYDRVRHLLEDETSLSRQIVSKLVDRMISEYDENDPSLHLYQVGASLRRCPSQVD
jgi:hypothetical protein